MICMVATIPFLHIITSTTSTYNSIIAVARGIEWCLPIYRIFIYASYTYNIALFHRQLTLLVCPHRFLLLLRVLSNVYFILFLSFVWSLVFVCYYFRNIGCTNMLLHFNEVFGTFVNVACMIFLNSDRNVAIFSTKRALFYCFFFLYSFL
jgi:hypothetical protein